MANNKYPQEFRDEAVRQILDRGYAVRDVAKSLGVPAHNLYKWVKQVRPAPERRKEEELLEAKREVLKLRADLHRVEEERDILKNALAEFALPHPCPPCLTFPPKTGPL